MDFTGPQSGFFPTASGDAGPVPPCSSDVDGSTDMSFSEEERDVSINFADFDQRDHLVTTVFGGDETMHRGDAAHGDDGDDDSMTGSDDEYVQEDDDEINMDAYDTSNLNNNGLQQTEQAGVIHLVHGWTQQAHSDQVDCTSMF